MASFLQYKTNGIQWAVWKMEESLDALLLLLPGARRAFCEQELNRFVSERRKMEWLSVRVLLYSMLQEDKEIGYSPEGKPYLTDHSFFISISHTKGYVAAILASLGSVRTETEPYRLPLLYISAATRTKRISHAAFCIQKNHLQLKQKQTQKN